MCRGHNAGNEAISVEAQVSHVGPFNVVIQKDDQDEVGWKSKYITHHFCP